MKQQDFHFQKSLIDKYKDIYNQVKEVLLQNLQTIGGIA